MFYARLPVQILCYHQNRIELFLKLINKLESYICRTALMSMFVKHVWKRSQMYKLNKARNIQIIHLEINVFFGNILVQWVFEKQHEYIEKKSRFTCRFYTSIGVKQVNDKANKAIFTKPCIHVGS